MARRKTYRLKANEDVTEVTFPSSAGGGEFKTVKSFPYETEDTGEQAFFDAHPQFTDRPEPKKRSGGRSSSRGSTRSGGSRSGQSQSAGSQSSTSQDPPSQESNNREENK